MKVKEAIERIQNHNRVHARKEPHAFYITEALKMAVKALEKQMPKMVIMNEDECLCPACSFDMMGVWDYPDVKDPNYCPECGQALKWRTNDGR